jgi:hypothetical protein
LFGVLGRMKTRRYRNRNRHRNTRYTKHRKSRRQRTLRRRGGSLGNIPDGAIVSIQQDPYSARLLVDAETAANIFEARGAYTL